MARIPEEEIERLKREVDLAALIRSKGIELKAHGGKDLAGRCPFHQDDTPSLIVTPAKNLFHCMGCGAGGSAIDFLMKHDGVSFRHAVELLRDGKANAFGGTAAKKTTVPKLPPPVVFDADDQTLFTQVLDYYRERLHANPAALEYLQQRGITAEAIEAFGIGFADRTLGLRLPFKNRKDGQEVRDRLTRIGLYRESGHEHFNGCVTFPIRDASGAVAEIYGRKIQQRQSTGIYHLYLPGPHRGLFNPAAFESPNVILTESVIDALSFWCAGLRNVTCIWGTEGFTSDHLDAFRKHKTQRVYLAYDNDDAGNRAAQRDVSRLTSIGIECFRLRFPAGHDPNSYVMMLSKAKSRLQRGDPNEYARKVTPAEKSLPVLLNSSEWLGKGSPSSNENSGTLSSSLAAKLAAETLGEPETLDEPKKAAKEGNAFKAEEPEVEITAKPEPLALEQRGEDLLLNLGEREYRVRGLHKNNAYDVLKVNLRLLHCDPSTELGAGRYHVDNVDLYQAGHRKRFIEEAAAETRLDPELVRRDLGKLLLKLEEAQEERLRAALEPAGPKIPVMSEADRAEALELLRSPDLLERILSAFETCGMVGEATNKLTGYLAAVSRKLARPLAVIVQSTSAAGKTALMEAVLAFVPEEERIKYSAMTGQSLYYLGETNLKNKILAIVEEEGAEKASYALKLLQSEGELTIASTGKDPATGRMETQEYHVEGPVMIFLTTTAVDIDEELLNRCLVLTVDEGREQTEAIHRIQREAETFEGLKSRRDSQRVLTLHRNAQRLLEPLPVVNPFAPQLTFLADRTRTRRDHVKYLALIRSITLLHQHQRPVQERDGLRYIEATFADIEAANRLAGEVLARSLDELPPQTRRLLGLIKEMVRQACDGKKLAQEDYLFSRRELRHFTSWSEYQVRVHLQKLEDLEYVLRRHGRQGASCTYELLYPSDNDEDGCVVGLLDLKKLRTA